MLTVEPWGLGIPGANPSQQDLHQLADQALKHMGPGGRAGQQRRLVRVHDIIADTHARDNIRTNNLPPGWIDSLPATEARRAIVPMQRCGATGEVAASVAFPVSEGAACITGRT